MKRHLPVIAAALLLSGLAASSRAATVSVGTYVCNERAQVRVPVALDSAKGLTGISVTLAFDPQVLVCSRVEEGTLGKVFDDEFLVTNENDGRVVAAMFRLGGNVADDIGGTVATLVFLARPGTAGTFADVTVTNVELMEESGVRDVTVEHPLSTVNGMVRVLPTGGSAARLEGAQTIVADTRLAALSLTPGDGIQASDAGTPVVVSGEVSTEAPIPVAAPDYGWATAVYTLLRTPTRGLTFSSATNAAERLDVYEERANGVSTYQLVVESVDGLCVLSIDDLDAGLQAYVRDTCKDVAGVDTVWVEGSVSDVSMARAFGLVPAKEQDGSWLTATFALPTLRITAIDVERGLITAQVTPAEGGSIAGDGKVTGIVELIGAPALGQTMLPLDRVSIDTSDYFTTADKGILRCTAVFGENAFFKVKIRDE